MTAAGNATVVVDDLDEPATTVPAPVLRPWIVAGVVGASTVAQWPGLWYPAWSVPVALRLAILPLGVVALAVAARHRDKAAIAALAFAGWSVLASLLATSRYASFFGMIGRYESALATVGVLGGWALARRLNSRDVRYALIAVLVVTTMSGVVALVQVVAKPTSGLLGLIYGQPGGLAGSPVAFGAHCAAAAAICARAEWRWLQRTRPALLLWFAFCAGLSGSRIAAIVVLMIGVFGCVRERQLRRVLDLGATASGLVLATAFVRLVGGEETSAIDRAGTAGVGDRLDLWKWSLRGAIERPLTGWGPSRSLQAMQQHYSDDWALRQGRGGDFTWTDPHNYFVNVTVTTGFVGLALFAAFLWFAVRGARGPAAWGAAAVFATWLVEPALPVTYLFGAVLLGLASVTGAGEESAELRIDLGRPVAIFALVMGTAIACVVLVADADLRNLEDGGDRMAASIFRFDSVYANARATYPFRDDIVEPYEYALDWMGEAAHREPDFPYLWARSATVAGATGDHQRALDHSDRALELQPNFPMALFAARDAYVALGRTAESENLTKRLCTIGFAEEC